MDGHNNYTLHKLLGCLPLLCWERYLLLLKLLSPIVLQNNFLHVLFCHQITSSMKILMWDYVSCSLSLLSYFIFPLHCWDKLLYLTGWTECFNNHLSGFVLRSKSCSGLKYTVYIQMRTKRLSFLPLYDFLMQHI